MRQDAGVNDLTVFALKLKSFGQRPNRDHNGYEWVEVELGQEGRVLRLKALRLSLYIFSNRQHTCEWLWRVRERILSTRENT